MFTWKKMQEFEQRTEQLNVGATRAKIRVVLGEPSRVTVATDDDAEDFDEIWEFDTPLHGYSFYIELENEVYLHAWGGWNIEREQNEETKP